MIPPLCNAAEELCQRPQRQRWEETQSAHQQHDKDEQEYKHSISRGERSGSYSNFLFFGQAARDGQCPYKGALKPAKAEPLFPPAEVYA